MPNIHPQTITKPNGETFTFNMVEVQGGTFMMGLGCNKHEVKLDSFLVAEYPVTQDLYEFVTGKTPSLFLGKSRPVEQIDWYDTLEFCNILNKLKRLDNSYSINKNRRDSYNQYGSDGKKWLVKVENTKSYRLPIEAEWEYAALGGKVTNTNFIFSGSNEPKKVAWYDNNGFNETVPVGLKIPNILGLYDMSGNVWEWCWDWYCENFHNKPYKESSLWIANKYNRIIRGGSWYMNSFNSKVTYRFWNYPINRNSHIGFRLFRSL